MIEMIHGKGTIEKRIPAMLRMYLNYDIDMREVADPGLPDPALSERRTRDQCGLRHQDHPQPDGAGEAVGGIHGRNRLMGNSLLDIIVFGRDAGKAAAARCHEVELGTMTLEHVEKFAKELRKPGFTPTRYPRCCCPPTLTRDATDWRPVLKGEGDRDGCMGMDSGQLVGQHAFDGVSHCSIGYLVGSIKVCGLDLGTAGILLVALVFGHLGGVRAGLVRDMGLVCFVTAVGFNRRTEIFQEL